MNVPDLISNHDLENIANASLDKLEEKYDEMLIFLKLNSKNVFIETINVSNYIRENYKKQLLFYTFNHPTKILLQKMCELILEKLNLENTINYELDPFDWYKGIIYKCIQKHVYFDINNHLPFFNNETDTYKICEIYYNAYQSNSFSFDS